MSRLTPPKSPMVYDKHSSGCMWGLYSLFDFRQIDSNRKLISDRKRSNKDIVIDNGYVRTSNLVTELDERFRGKNKRFPHPNLVETKKKKKGCGCKNVDFVKYDELLKVNDVAEAIVNQKLIEGKYLNREGVNPRSKQLLDALEILNSNKELFTKLLQDPNSLLVKHIQELRDSSHCESSSEQRQSEEIGSEIVVLKPGLTSKNDHGIERHAGSFVTNNNKHFSFGDIKRKFKHAMGAKRKDSNLMVSIDGVKLITKPSETRGAEEVRRKYRNEYDDQRRDKIEKLRDFKARIGQEMAASRNESTENHQSKKSSAVASDMRYSPYSYTQVTYDNWKLTKEQKASYAGSLKHNIEAMIDRNKSCNRLQFSHNQVFEHDSSTRGESSPIEVESNVTEANSDTMRDSSVETSDVISHEEEEETSISKETEDSESSRLDSSLEDQSSTCSSYVFPSTPSSTQISDDHEGLKDDVGESSPISVLEQYFVYPCQLDKDHHAKLTEISTLNFERISEYVKALLLASGLDQERLFPDLRESDKLLSEAVNSQSNKLCGDCKLIFDCVSDVLIELNESHFKHSPWLSFVGSRTRNLRPFQVENIATREATKRVDFFFLESPIRSMEFLIGDDLRRSEAWLDIRSDVEDIVVEIAEDALEDLIMESIDELYIYDL